MAATNTALLYTTVGQLRDLRDRTKSAAGVPNPLFEKPTRSTVITDTYTNISPGGDVNDAVYSKYLVQNLIPDTTYVLKFKVFRPVTVAGATTWVDEMNPADYLTPSTVNTLSDATVFATGNSTPGSFYWSNQLPSRQLLFLTKGYDDSTISGSGFGANRQTYNYDPTYDGGADGGAIPDGTELYNVPPVDAVYSSFDSRATSFQLEANGKPTGGFDGSGLPVTGMHPQIDTFDAYLFIFEKPLSVQADYNKYYTQQVFTAAPNYVGAKPDSTHYEETIKNGFKSYNAINVSASASGGSNQQSINIVPDDFNSTNGTFGHYRNGQGLVKTQEYVAGLMLVNRTSKYVVEETSLVDSQRYVKWFTNLIPTGGVWSIALGEFILASNTHAQTSDATSVAVRVDSIGVQGTVPTSFRIQIFAEPYTPL